jgi:hypothetical protein
MSTELFEDDGMTVTRGAIRCGSCNAKPPNYQITTAGGDYVQLCPLCIERVSVAVAADQRRSDPPLAPEVPR